MDTNFRAGDGRWRSLFRPKGTKVWYARLQRSGKDIVKSTHATELPAAKKRATQIVDEILRGDVIDMNATFDDLVKRFEATRGDRHKNDGVMSTRLRATFGKGPGEPAAGMQLKARQVRPGDLQTWLTTQAHQGSAKGNPWKGRTFNHYRLWLKQIFELAVADRLITHDENPFASKMIKRRRLDPVTRNIPTPEQFAAIIAEVRANHPYNEGHTPRGPELADFLEFLGLAGVGQAEAVALRKCHVLENKMRFIRRKTGVPFEVPIYSWLAPLLQRRLAMTANPQDVLFHNGDAGRALSAACDRLGLTHFTQRGLRAMLIKRLYDSGVPIKRIAQWQGHRDGGKLIMEVYTEVFSDLDDAAEEADLARVGGAVSIPIAA